MRILLYLLTGLILGGCAGTADHDHDISYEPRYYRYQGKANIDLNNTYLVRKKLFEQYHQWKGTRYTYGGLSRKGIDCSGLVKIAYLSGLGIELPRTTRLQVKVGREVEQDELQAGDLIFFKTGYYDRHVGIYIGDGQFFHASQSKGVIISSLENIYWSGNYWVSKRIH